MKELETLLHALGLSRKYVGYDSILMAVDIVMHNRRALNNVKADIYTVIADARGCTWSAVERSIRTAIKHMWKTHRDQVKELLLYYQGIQPTATELIDLLVLYLEYAEPIAKKAETKCDFCY